MAALPRRGPGSTPFLPGFFVGLSRNRSIIFAFDSPTEGTQSPSPSPPRSLLKLRPPDGAFIFGQSAPRGTGTRLQTLATCWKAVILGDVESPGQRACWPGLFVACQQRGCQSPSPP